MLCTGFPAGCHSQAASVQVFARADCCRKTAACTSCMACGSQQCCFTGSWSRYSLCTLLCVLFAAVFPVVPAAGSRILDLNDRNICQNTGPSDLAEATFSLPIAQGQKELHECCFGDLALELAQHLTAAVELGLNVRAPASMQQVRCLSHALLP